jgi:hypothetical protein
LAIEYVSKMQSQNVGTIQDGTAKFEIVADHIMLIEIAVGIPFFAITFF